MDQREHKKMTHSDSVISRGALEETIRVLRSAHPKIANKLQSIINCGPIEKPDKHRGGPETDLFQVELEQSELEVIVEVFGDLEVINVSSMGKTTPKASHYAAMLDAWNAAT